VFDELGRFSALAAVLGIVVTGVYLAALIERRNRTVLRMGIDSILVIVVYVGGTALLYGLRGG
jgi:cation:H+ antiporter